MKHRFAEKGAADRDAVESAREFVLAPRFDGMRVTKFVQSFVTLDDLGIDPGILSFGAGANNFTETIVDLDFENLPALHAPQIVRNVKAIERNNGARIGREPADGMVPQRQRKTPEPGTLQQKFRLDHWEFQTLHARLML